MARPVRAYIGLGSNVGDPEATLAAAVRALGALPGANLVGVSRLYATEPVGMTDQPEFRNAVVALDVPARPGPSIGAISLLVALKNIERAFGRRAGPRWGPRELDLDLLIFGRHQLVLDRPPEGMSLDAFVAPTRTNPLLEVPHPLAHERLFVLAPLSELAPHLVPPGWNETVGTARQRRFAVEGAASVRPVAEWGPGSKTWVSRAFAR